MKKILPLLAIFQLQPISAASDMWSSFKEMGDAVKESVAELMPSVNSSQPGTGALSSSDFSFTSSYGSRLIDYQRNPVRDLNEVRGEIVNLLKQAFNENVQSSFLDGFVAFRFPTLGRTFETATQAFVSGLTARDIEKGVFIDHREPTAPKFSSHSSEAVRKFTEMVDALNKDFYPHINSFNGWLNGENYEGRDISLNELKDRVAHHKWRLGESRVAREERNYSSWILPQYQKACLFKCLQLMPEFNHLNWVNETGATLTGEQRTRFEYLNWILSECRSVLS
jgi:hypothetical protein